MNWSVLESPEQIAAIKHESNEKPVLIFKHSTRCGTSRMVLDRLQRSGLAELEAKLYFLDLISFRETSNQVAYAFNVVHESPQVLIIKNEKAVWNESHFGIDFASIHSVIQNLQVKN